MPTASETGSRVEAVAIPGKLPVHLERRRAADPRTTSASGSASRRTGRTLAYLRGVGGVDGVGATRADRGRCRLLRRHVLVERRADRALGLGTKRAEEMAHLPVGGPGGSLAQLADVPRGAADLHPHQQHQPDAARGLAPSGAAVGAAGWEIAEDGMEVRL